MSLVELSLKKTLDESFSDQETSYCANVYSYIIISLEKIYNQVAATNSHLISAHCIDYVLGSILMSLFWSISVNWPKICITHQAKEKSVRKDVDIYHIYHPAKIVVALSRFSKCAILRWAYI